MSKWISGQQLLKDFDIRDFELFHDYVKKGLQPYSELGEPISPQFVVERITQIPLLTENYHQMREIVEELGGEELQKFDATRGHDLIMQMKHYEEWIEKSRNIDWVEFNLPETDAEAKAVIALLVGSLYQIEDIKDFFGVKTILAVKDGTVAEAVAEGEGPEKKKVHHTVPHMLRAQAKAVELWAGKYKGYTVPRLAETQEMLDACRKKDGNIYSERKIREWIKDLNPNKPLKGAPTKDNSN